MYLCKLTQKPGNFNLIKNSLINAFYSLEFLSMSSKYIYKILSLPAIESYNNYLLTQNSGFYSFQSKLLSKHAFCIPRNLNLNVFALNSKNSLESIQNNSINASGVLLLYKSLFDLGKAFNFDSKLNNFMSINSITYEKFFFSFTKISNLIYRIKIFPSLMTNFSIIKISIIPNWSIFAKQDQGSTNSNSTSSSDYSQLIFSKNDNTLTDENTFEIKFIDLNILNKNIIFKIEYINDKGTAMELEDSCIIFEEMKIDQNFSSFSEELEKDTLTQLISSNNNTNKIIIIVLVTVLGFVICLVLIILLYKRLRRNSMNISEIKNEKGEKSVYNNLELNTGISKNLS